MGTLVPAALGAFVQCHSSRNIRQSSWYGRASYLLLAAVVTAFPGCKGQSGSASRPIKGAHVEMATPTGWERKPNQMVFRRTTGGATVAFLAVDEVPTSGARPDAVVADLVRMFRSGSRTIDTQLAGKWHGLDALDLSWHGATSKGTKIQGRQRYVMLPTVVISILAYAPTERWGQQQRALDSVVESIEVRP